MEIRLKEIMDQQGMKSVEMAARLGVTKQTISNLVNGRVMPSIDTIAKAADILGVPMWQMFANPSDIGNTVVCPKCGAVIKIKSEVE